ncbi:hypothetical protein VPNG_07604 [Cytospora leucostoma]|uniref:AMP-dependent synthetase/ligase domain-containing protein n=1 Tax=Cytospora leucostoma TaxID=1230097 RepID=A0A423WDF6_9PEZI|nr:hypothetical protein VPNG_07604 [Cytospora leucostoma]
MASSVAPGIPGERLLPTIIDELAREDPDRPWASIPRDDYDLSQGFADISYAGLANAVNKLAWLIEGSIGRSDSFETIAYLGTPDIRYHMMQMAVCKTGHKERELTSNDIRYTHAMIATQDAQEYLPDVCGREHLQTLHKPGKGVRFIMVTLPFHALSAGFAMIMTVFGGAIFVPGFAHRAVRPDEICDILEHANVTRSLFTPWMMETIARHPKAQSYIEPFDSAMYCGAALPEETARTWAQWTLVRPAWGATETLAPPQLVADNEDYSYVFFDPVYSGIEFRDAATTYAAEDGSEVPLYEMVFTITPEVAPVASWHANNGVDIDAVAARKGPPGGAAGKKHPELRIGDIWTPHPDPAKARFAWRFIGRVDDIITFSSGVNYHPGPMEKLIKGHGAVSEALVLGRGHQQPVALIELHAEEGEFAAEDIKDEIWVSCIDPGNSIVPAHGKVSYTHIIILPAGSFIRTMKGNVIRKQTGREFSGAIDGVYAEFGDEWQDGQRRYGSISKSISLEVSVEVQDGTETA